MVPKPQIRSGLRRSQIRPATSKLQTPSELAISGLTVLVCSLLGALYISRSSVLRAIIILIQKQHNASQKGSFESDCVLVKVITIRVIHLKCTRSEIAIRIVPDRHFGKIWKNTCIQMVPPRQFEQAVPGSIGTMCGHRSQRFLHHRVFREKSQPAALAPASAEASSSWAIGEKLHNVPT